MTKTTAVMNPQPIPATTAGLRAVQKLATLSGHEILLRPPRRGR